MAKANTEMQKSSLAKSKPGPPTQNYLDIAEIREDTVVLKNGELRAVLMVSSVNFALKSQDEQQATIQAYMQFLNGLEHPLQIVVQSRRMNIDRYLMSLSEQEAIMNNDLLKAQLQDYRTFISDLVDLGDIMQKRFYVVIPYSAREDKKRGFWTKFSSALSPASIVKLTQKEFRNRKDRLDQRASIAASGLTGMGLRSARLDTQGLIELYYTVYNPDVFDHQKMANISDIRVEEGF
ncbi:MAG: hypothetical protein O3B64_03725 [bacterium]|nr:hypothetical protein [bacterium]